MSVTSRSFLTVDHDDHDCENDNGNANRFFIAEARFTPLPFTILYKPFVHVFFLRLILRQVGGSRACVCCRSL
jgi:hypothetical protein